MVSTQTWMYIYEFVRYDGLFPNRSRFCSVLNRIFLIKNGKGWLLTISQEACALGTTDRNKSWFLGR